MFLTYTDTYIGFMEHLKSLLLYCVMALLCYGQNNVSGGPDSYEPTSVYECVERLPSVDTWNAMPCDVIRAYICKRGKPGKRGK